MVYHKLNWKILNQYAPLIRLGGNWGVSFFGSYVGFDFITDLPTEEMVWGSLLASSVTTLLALSYEARKFQLGKRHG